MVSNELMVIALMDKYLYTYSFHFRYTVWRNEGQISYVYTGSSITWIGGTGSETETFRKIWWSFFHFLWKGWVVMQILPRNSRVRSELMKQYDKSRFEHNGTHIEILHSAIFLGTREIHPGWTNFLKFLQVLL